jgi:hypothetical protein
VKQAVIWMVVHYIQLMGATLAGVHQLLAHMDAEPKLWAGKLLLVGVSIDG